MVCRARLPACRRRKALSSNQIYVEKRGLEAGLVFFLPRHDPALHVVQFYFCVRMAAVNLRIYVSRKSFQLRRIHFLQNRSHTNLDTARFKKLYSRVRINSNPAAAPPAFQLRVLRVLRCEIAHPLSTLLADHECPSCERVPPTSCGRRTRQREAEGCWPPTSSQILVPWVSFRTRVPMTRVMPATIMG